MKNEEFIALLKSTVKENRLDKIPDGDLLEICKRARSIDASSNNLDIELSKAINTLLEEIKKRKLPQDTKQEIPNYEDSSLKQNKAGGSSKWVFTIAISAIVIALVIIISNYSLDKTGTEVPKTPTFDILGYYNKYKDYYGDISLEDVAKDAYRVGEYDLKYPDYESWKKARGIEPLIQEDIKRRTPSFLNKLMGAIPFRYYEESIHGFLYRYDRFTRTVEQRYGTDENSFKWVPRPKFKNLQHVRDFMAQWERNKQIRATEEQNEELNRNIDDMKSSVEDVKREQEDRAFRERIGINPNPMERDRKNEELKRSIEDIKGTLEAEKRERESRDMQRRLNH